jgi:hypothetical protein
VFVPGKPIQRSLEFRDKQSSLVQKPYITAVISFMKQAPGLTHKYWTKKFSFDKHSSLFRLSAKDEGEKVYNIAYFTS